MKKRRLLIWAGVLVVCIACYLFLGKKNDRSENTENEETDTASVLAVPADTITGFSFTENCLQKTGCPSS